MDHKRKREDKDKKVLETGRTQSSQEVDFQRGSKHPRGMQTRSAHEADKKGEHHVAAPAWVPPLELDGSPLTSDASIRDPQRGTTGYVPHTVEQTLVLPRDMADLRSMRTHKVFFGLKRELAMVRLLLFTYLFYLILVIIIIIIILTSSPSQAVQVVFRAEEMVSSYHQLFKEEEGGRIAAVEAFQVAEKSNKDLKSKLTKEEKERNFVAAAPQNTEKQAKNQRLLLCSAEDQLATCKEQITTLKKKLEEVEKAKAKLIRPKKR